MHWGFGISQVDRVIDQVHLESYARIIDGSTIVFFFSWLGRY